MLQHRFIFTLSAQTLPEISTFFLCLSACPFLRVTLNSHSIFPNLSPHLFTKFSHCHPWTSAICGLQQCWQNSCGSMHAFPANNQTISCFFKSWAQSNRKLLYADNCNTINWTAGESSKGYYKLKRNWPGVTRSTDIFHCSTASAYLKNSEDFGVDGLVMDKIHTTV